MLLEKKQCTARFSEIVYNQPFALYFIRILLEFKIKITTINVIEKKKLSCIIQAQKTKKKNIEKKKYECEQCGYIYEPAVGNLNIDIALKITFEYIPEHWVCPIYGFGKDVFVPLEE